MKNLQNIRNRTYSIISLHRNYHHCSRHIRKMEIVCNRLRSHWEFVAEYWIHWPARILPITKQLKIALCRDSRPLKQTPIEYDFQNAADPIFIYFFLWPIFWYRNQYFENQSNSVRSRLQNNLINSKWTILIIDDARHSLELPQSHPSCVE